MFCSDLARRFRIPLAGMLTLLALLWGLAPAPAAHAQSAPVLLRDINTTATDHKSSYPEYMAVVGNTIFFTATSPFFGTELWKSDGTARGTKLVKDIWPGANSSSPTNLTDVYGTLYFVANDGVHGSELWRSDGTAAGTRMVKEIFQGQNGSYPNGLHESNGKLYFTANDGSHGSETWVSDGTAAGTMRVADTLESGPARLSNYTEWNGKYYYWDYSTHALCQTDGTTAGTVKVISLNGAVYYIYSVSGRLYFILYSWDDWHYYLWSSDGTAAGTVRLLDMGSSLSLASVQAPVTTANGWAYLYAQDSETTVTLCRTDGTPAGTVRLCKVKNPMAINNHYPVDRALMLAINNTLYFNADDGKTGMELWKTDGTVAGTALVKDILSGAEGSAPHNLVNVAGRLFFDADDGKAGRELWKSDGTAAGTVMVRDIRPGLASGIDQYGLSSYYRSSGVASGGTLYFAADDGIHGMELWKSDGSAAGTVMVGDIAVGNDAVVSNFTAVGRNIFFMADDTVHGRELWKSDGTAAGTGLVRDICPGPESGLVPIQRYNVLSVPYIGVITDSGSYNSDAANFTSTMVNAGGILYFAATDMKNGAGLYRSDGTAAGTYALRDHFPNIAGIAAVGKTVFFANFYDTLVASATGQTNPLTRFRHIFELWSSDGTKAGTKLLKRITTVNSSVYSYGSGSLMAFGSKLFFGLPGTVGSGIWASDGTVEGTKQIVDLKASSNIYANSPSNLMPAGSKFFFSMNGQVWASNGTASGTVMVRQGVPMTMAVAGGKLFMDIYDAKNQAYGEELYVSDGTASGTKILKDLWPGVEGSRPKNLTAVGSKLFFSAADYDHGRELWVSDGTVAGTYMVKDIAPGQTGSHPENLVNAGNGQVLFSAYDPAHGTELWVSDGTAAGTHLAAEITAGTIGSNPQRLAVVGNMLFCTAVNGANPWQGRELWGWKMPAPSR